MCQVETVPADWWQRLDAPWRRAFHLAWESLSVGSPPVGAVVLDEVGALVGEGRSRRGESDAPAGSLGGSALAHAEVNALAALPVGNHRQLTLRVTLQPCLLCTAAVIMSKIGSVEFAGQDPLWNYLPRLASVDPWLEVRWVQLQGPLAGPPGEWASVLALIDLLELKPGGSAVAAFQSAAPGLLAAARAVRRTCPRAELVRLGPAAATDLVTPLLPSRSS